MAPIVCAYTPMPVMPTVSFRLDPLPAPKDWFNALLRRWGVIEPPARPERRVDVIWSHGYGEIVIAAGGAEIGRITDVNLVRRGMSFQLPDSSTLRVSLHGKEFIVARNGHPLIRVGDPARTIQLGVDFLYFCALWYGIPGVIFGMVFLREHYFVRPALMNLIAGVLLIGIGFWASRAPLPALWVGAGVIIGRTIAALQGPATEQSAAPQWDSQVRLATNTTMFAVALLVPVVRAAYIATKATIEA